jgi:hypothetical protein
MGQHEAPLLLPLGVEWLVRIRQKAALGDQVGIVLLYRDSSCVNGGAPGRLDYTAIVPSLNLRSRVERLCKRVSVTWQQKIPQSLKVGMAPRYIEGNTLS